MKRPISQFKRATARRLRNNDTQAEQILWRRLRQLEVPDTHFRRQVPIGRYIADFACLTQRLVIEVDGSRHCEASNVSHDDVRRRWLEQEGYRVLRFWNNEVMAQTDSVMDAIFFALTPPRPQDADDPPPQGEGEDSIRGNVPHNN